MQSPYPDIIMELPVYNQPSTTGNRHGIAALGKRILIHPTTWRIIVRPHNLRIIIQVFSSSPSAASIETTSGNRGVILHSYGTGFLRGTSQQSRKTERKV